MSTSVASPPAEPATATAAPRRLRPHQLVLGLGVFAGLFTLLSGVLPVWTGWHDVSPISREVFSGVPDPLVVAFYAVIPVLLVYVSYLFSLRVRNWERGTPDRRPHDGRQRPPPPRGLPGRRVHADAAAGPRGRPHALPHLLRLPRPAGRHRDPRDRPPGPREPQVPARHHLPGVLLRRRRRRPRVPGRHRLGHRPPLRPAAVPHPDQDEARARGDPRRVPGHRADRLRDRDVPHRVVGIALVREVELRRVPAGDAGRRRQAEHARGLAPGPCGSPTCSPSAPSS